MLASSRAIAQICFLLAIAGGVRMLRADPPREYVDAQGNTVRETRETVKRLVWETKEVEQTQTVMEPKLQTEYQTQVRQYQVPVVETVLVPELVGRWNPFVTPHYEYRQQQRTRYELRQDSVQVPIVKQEWTSNQRTIKVPQLVQREVEEEIIRKVVVRDMPASSLTNGGSQLARLPQGQLSQSQFPQGQFPQGVAAPAGMIPLGGPSQDPFAQAPGANIARRDVRTMNPQAQPPVTGLPQPSARQPVPQALPQPTTNLRTAAPSTAAPITTLPSVGANRNAPPVSSGGRYQ